MRLAAGTLLSHYEIVALIGTGGMGTVYRARDTLLGRTVAIKLVDNVSDGIFSSTDLLQEAQHASALNHPNICTIHEVGEAEGHRFIVMEHVEGRPLSEMISTTGLPLERVIGVGIQIAEAVAHAHDCGILHRDLKPLNVMVTLQGRVKIMDFGLATRAWTDEAAHAATRPLARADTVAGTIAYMAPEVLQGHPAGVSSDIWALGATLYELTTGRLPFSGRTTFELSAQILREPAPPLPSNVPSGLAAVIQRCLRKEPGERYQHVPEIAAALDACRAAIAVGPPSHHRSARRVAVSTVVALSVVTSAYLALSNRPLLAFKSVAVVPFVNEDRNPDTEYLSDGITESVVNSLSQLTLKVIALSSTRQYRGKQVDAQSVGRDLAVEAVVFGRVARRANSLTVSAELVNVQDRSRMWGATYNTQMSEVLVTQDDIATRISDNLRLRLEPEARKKLTKRYTDNVSAYNLYLQGRYLWNQYTEEGWTKAIDYFRQAIEIDRNYALAYAGIADSYYQLSSLVAAPADVMPSAKAAAIKALAIDEGLAEAHASLAIIKSQYEWDRPGAAREFRRALELNSNYANAHQWYGMYLYADGRFEQALVEFRRAQVLDPLTLIIGVTAIWPLPRLGRHADAVRELERVMAIHPNVPALQSYFHELRGEMYMQTRRYDEAAEDFALGFRTQSLTGGDAPAVAALRAAYKASGFAGYWQQQMALAAVYHRDKVEQASRQVPARYVSPFRLAELHARLGETERAFALLEQCYASRDENLVWLKAEALAAGSPWQNLSSDPRFGELLRRLGLGQ